MFFYSNSLPLFPDLQPLPCEQMCVSISYYLFRYLISFPAHPTSHASPMSPHKELQCTTNTEPIFSALSRLYLLLNCYMCKLYLYTKRNKQKKR